MSSHIRFGFKLKLIMLLIVLMLPIISCSDNPVRSGSDDEVADCGQWCWQNPLPQGNRLNSLSFIDLSTGVAVGD